MSCENKNAESKPDPMGMMKKMMGGGGPSMEMGMKMCSQMSKSVERTSEMAAYATPELRQLFENWLEEVEKEALNFISENDTVSISSLSEKLGITDESSVFIFSKLARAGKLDVTVKVKS